MICLGNNNNNDDDVEIKNPFFMAEKIAFLVKNSPTF